MSFINFYKKIFLLIILLLYVKKQNYIYILTLLLHIK